MANITIVTTNKAGKIDVDFGAYADGDQQAFETRYNSSDITKVERFDGYVGVTMRDTVVWYLTYTALDSYFIVDLIDGDAPTDNDDLFTLIRDL